MHTANSKRWVSKNVELSTYTEVSHSMTDARKEMKASLFSTVWHNLYHPTVMVRLNKNTCQVRPSVKLETCDKIPWCNKIVRLADQNDPIQCAASTITCGSTFISIGTISGIASVQTSGILVVSVNAGLCESWKWPQVVPGRLYYTKCSVQ